MNNKTKNEIVLGIVVFAIVVIGGLLWLGYKDRISSVYQQNIPAIKSSESLTPGNEYKKVANKSDLLEVLKIKNEVECEKDRVIIFTDGKRIKIEYKTDITASSPGDKKFNIIDDGIYTYRWIEKRGEKIKFDSSSDNTGNFWENNFEDLAKNQDLRCRPVEMKDVDFIPPSDVDFKSIDASGMKSF